MTSVVGVVVVVQHGMVRLEPEKLLSEWAKEVQEGTVEGKPLSKEEVQGRILSRW